MSDVVVGLDIGTTNVRAVVGKILDDNSLQIAGVGVAPSTGLRNGLIVNIESTMKSINEAIEKAELTAGLEVTSCFTTIGGAQIESLISKGFVPISTKSRTSREINKEDIERVIEASRAINIPLDRQILHIVPRTYIVDGQGGIKNPFNMLGVRLEAEVCIITSSVTSTQNVLRCISRAGYTVDGVFLKTLVAADLIITEEEQELGSIFIDLGAGTTDVLIVAEGAALCAISVPVGGQLITNDISLVKGVSFDTAEKIKLQHGCCWEPLIDPDETVIIPGIGGNAPEEIYRTEICQIIQPRVEEIFDLIREKLPQQVKRMQLNGSIILAGAGALLPGIAELAAKEFKTDNVRIGIPSNYGGASEQYRSPEFATAVGVLLEGYNQQKIKNISGPRHEKNSKSMLTGMVQWFKEFF